MEIQLNTCGAEISTESGIIMITTIVAEWLLYIA
jgi:hypothetical protein